MTNGAIYLLERTGADRMRLVSYSLPVEIQRWNAGGGQGRRYVRGRNVEIAGCGNWQGRMHLFVSVQRRASLRRITERRRKVGAMRRKGKITAVPRDWQHRIRVRASLHARPVRRVQRLWHDQERFARHLTYGKQCKRTATAHPHQH